MNHFKKLNTPLCPVKTGTIDALLAAETDKNKETANRNSLAYLAFESQKQKGLISPDKERPVFYFGDEWPL